MGLPVWLCGLFWFGLFSKTPRHVQSQDTGAACPHAKRAEYLNEIASVFNGSK